MNTQHSIPFYWFLFPPCEGCTVLRPRFRPVVIIPPHITRFRLPKFIFIRNRRRPLQK